MGIKTYRNKHTTRAFKHTHVHACRSEIIINPGELLIDYNDFNSILSITCTIPGQNQGLIIRSGSNCMYMIGLHMNEC